ncbi:MAG: hypothetical protein AAGA77_03455 [Bacteroidota bacterium]
MNWKVMLFLLFLALSCKPGIYLQKNQVKLAKPMLSADEIFFEDYTQIYASQTEADAHIEFSVNGEDKIKNENPIKVLESSLVEAQALGGGFMASVINQIQVWKLPKNEIISIRSDRVLDDKYGVQGLDILIDRKKGTKDFNNGWLGYLGDTVEFDLEFDIIEIDHILISTLRNHNAWIFSPTSINVFKNGKVISSLQMDDAKKSAKENMYYRLDISDIEAREVTIQMIAPKSIPEGHPGAGEKPWLFIDEILVY